MKFKLIACKSMSRELSYFSALSKNNIDITWMRQGYHNTPDILRGLLQEEIDRVEAGTDPHTNAQPGNGQDIYNGSMEDFDAILLGYGLCSNSVTGLHSRRYPLVIPRAHDCITMFLGSRERYMECFEKLPGCFWYTASWIENSGMPCPATHERELDYYRQQGLDEENIAYFDEILHGWIRHYNYAGYIRMPFYDDPRYEEFTRDAAKSFNWEYRELEGEMGLFSELLDGNWDEDKFLVVPPGYTACPSNDSRVITCCKPEEL